MHDPELDHIATLTAQDAGSQVLHLVFQFPPWETAVENGVANPQPVTGGKEKEEWAMPVLFCHSCVDIPSANGILLD